MKQTAQEIMTAKMITVEPEQSVVEAYRLMEKNRIRHLPVRDSSGVLIGLLSDRDIQRCIRFDRTSHSRQLDIALNLDPKIKVAEAMSWPAIKVRGDVPIRDVAMQMLIEKLSSIIVECPQTGRHGIITTDDLLKLLVTLLDKDPSRMRLSVTSIVDHYHDFAMSS